MADNSKRILIVEDNKLDARLLKDILEGRGYETLQTGDGLEAINLAVANLPDLILMDIQLPEISGLELTRRLRGDDRSRRIPIVAVTAFAIGWHEREALDSGCDGYISKPIAIFGFLRTVESFLSRFSPRFRQRMSTGRIVYMQLDGLEPVLLEDQPSVAARSTRRSPMATPMI